MMMIINMYLFFCIILYKFIIPMFFNKLPIINNVMRNINNPYLLICLNCMIFISVIPCFHLIIHEHKSSFILIMLSQLYLLTCTNNQNSLYLILSRG